MSKPTKIFLTLVRHGQTTHNKLKIIQGQMETELTELGREQAKLLAKHLEETKERFDRVYASDLIRAYETCVIVCNSKYEIRKNQLLRERLFGELQGFPLSDLKKKALIHGFNEFNFTQYVPEGGESKEEVLARVEKFCVEELFQNALDNESIMIVTHGGVIREFMVLFKRWGCALAAKDFVISPNTGINRFEITLTPNREVENISILFLHSIPHLSALAKDEALEEEQLNDGSTKEKHVEYAI